MANENQKLTENERLFCLEITRTDPERPMTAIEAYTRVYPALGQRRTNINEASKVMKRPHIKARIAEIHTALEDDRRRSTRATMASVQTKLWDIANKAPEFRDQISALRAITAMLPKKIEDDPLKDSAASKAQLIERMKQIFEDNQVEGAIEVEEVQGSINPEVEPEPDDELCRSEELDDEDTVLTLEAEIVERGPDH